MKDYYLILGISPEARQSEIKEAFRKLCLKYHPDRIVANSYAEERYIDICQAYKVLSNTGRRILYDKKLARQQLKVANADANSLSLKDAIFPELKTSYKGHYPWFAIFSIIIACGIVLIFLYASSNGHAPKAHPRTSFTPIIVEQPIHRKAKNPAPAHPDSMKAVIVSALKTHTPKVIVENLDNNPNPSLDFSYKEQHYNYSFKGGQLIVTYDIRYKDLIIRKKVSIPYHDVAFVYFYKQHLWICNNKESIKDTNLNTGYSYSTDFFSVKFNNSNSVDSQLLSAFNQLKNI